MATIALTEHCSLLLDTQGVVWGSGSNHGGELGSTDDDILYQHKKISDLPTILGVYGGRRFSFFFY